MPHQDASRDDEPLSVELESVRATLQELERVKQALFAEKATMEAEIAAMTSEKAAWQEERTALLARIHHLTTLLSGAITTKPKVRPELLTSPVDAGATPREAEDKQEARERAEQERQQRAKDKHQKKGKGADGKAKLVNGGGRKPVNRQLPEVTVKIPVPEAQRVDADGIALVHLRWERSEQEHYIPAGVVRLVQLIEIMGPADTHEATVRAPIPPRIVPRGKYSDAMIIEMMVRKYMRGMPFYRVLQDMRAMGSDLSDSTLSDLARQLALVIAPVAQAIRSQVLRELVAHIDETSFPTHDGTRYLWAMLGGRQVTMHVGGRGGNELRMLLGLVLKDPTPGERARAEAYKGRTENRFANIMADGYTIYDTVLGEAGIGRMSCWAHGVRGLEPFEKEPIIGPLVIAIRRLYVIEKHAKRLVEQQGLEGQDAIDVYAQLRAEQSKPQLAIIRSILESASPQYPKGTDQRKAIDYVLGKWESFIIYGERGDLPIDNNDVERAFRMIVVGRKNWMLIGSEDAAPHAATLFSLMESCRLSRVEPRSYLTHVVQRLHAGDTAAEDLTPKALAERFPIRE